MAVDRAGRQGQEPRSIAGRDHLPEVFGNPWADFGARFANIRCRMPVHVELGASAPRRLGRR